MQERLTLGPSWVQAVKPALTRARTLGWQARGAPVRPGLRILFYHRVADEPDPLAIAPRRFAEQMDLLRDEGYRAVDVVEAARLLARCDPVDRVVALSFDDGYRDVAENALPVLERCGFRATVFVAPSVVDGSATFSWYAHQPPVLSWADIVALDGGSALSFEAHTLTHPNLTAIAEAAAREEIAGSKAALEARLERPVTAFCYPAGLYGARERRLVADAGFRTATTCEPGANQQATDPLTLSRIAVNGSDGIGDFRAKVRGGHDRASTLRGGYRRVRYRSSAAR
jgi:peptidoglycan/xylan/chitin deacetylase (PgdA/CDA1 family)